MSQTLGQTITSALRNMAHAFAPGDQVAPCAVIWPDPERLWESIIPQVQALVPELFALGDYDAAKRTGPSLWLRCIEARTVDGAPPAGTVPIFYLPGISRDKLRAAEDCPQELAALVELQYRGVMWLHVNGKEWTPNGFLVSKHGGLDLDVGKDQATLDALAGALPTLLDSPISQLIGRRLDAEFFNGMVAPDATGLLLRWLSDPDGFQKRCSDAEWKAFCQQCKTDFRFDPVKEGPLKAAQLLAGRGDSWKKAWQRFVEAPANYTGIVEWLKRAAPKDPQMFDTAEVWPDLNEREERVLQQALTKLVDLPQHEAAKGIAALEKQHGVRRAYAWQKLDLSPLATALEPLAKLAHECQTVPGAASSHAYAEQYAISGWQVDAAALAAMAACGTQEQHGSLLGALRAVYLPWLEDTARQLQQLIRADGQAVSKLAKPHVTAPGRLLLFADGLRMDIGQLLVKELARAGIVSAQEWEWSAIPSVTATAKPAASPITDKVQGADVGDAFTTRFISSGQVWTQDRFIAALNDAGWQFLKSDETGDPSGSAWTEAGSLDRRGHDEGWKLARSVESEVRDLASRIGALLKAGWTEVIVVTDHGWLLLPGGLPKVELKAGLADHRWGRCAAMKSDSQTDVPTLKWHWNENVVIASPPGVGCFRASLEYTHGGVSLQEMVTPVLRISSNGGASENVAKLLGAKWGNANCRVTVSEQAVGFSVDVRTLQADPETSLLANHQAQKVKPDGKVSIFLEDDADIGRRAEIVLLDPSGKVIDSLPTTLGE